VSVVAFARGRVKASQQHLIRELMRRVVEEKAKTLMYDQLSHEMVLGKIGSDIYNIAKKIVPLRHIGVRKSKLQAMPAGVMVKPGEKLTSKREQPIPAK
jgi:small subunit ribosomal protein S3Ae